MDLLVKCIQKNINAKPNLVSSKSESNRALIIDFLTSHSCQIVNLSNSKDTKIMQEALTNISKNLPKIDVEDCGTAFRFLTALLSIISGEWILTGSERMKQRPIGILVEALKTLGANVEYLEKDGFPPLKIIGQQLNGGVIEINTSQSSQFLSGILMIAPLMPQGLRVDYKGLMVSKPYVDMTIKMMVNTGIQVDALESGIIVSPGTYQNHTININGDWSSASYWFGIAAISAQCDILLRGLQLTGLQGDEYCKNIFEELGIITTVCAEGVYLTKQAIVKQKFVFNCANYPDLVPALSVTLAALDLDGVITGIGSLKIKESDRITVISEQLNALGFHVSNTDNTIQIHQIGISSLNPIKVKTYNDHRIAMAFSMLSVGFGAIEIENAEVVNKSYPGYWNDMETAGFVLKPI